MGHLNVVYHLVFTIALSPTGPGEPRDDAICGALGTEDELVQSIRRHLVAEPSVKDDSGAEQKCHLAGASSYHSSYCDLKSELMEMMECAHICG